MTKEEMEQQIHDFAEMMYKVGFEDGQKSCKENDQDYKDGLEDGRMEAWECARKIMDLTSNDIKRREIIGDCAPKYALTRYSASEAIAKIKEYEEQKNEIHVGDEVVSDAFDEKGIVTHINDKNCVSLICGMSSMINTSLDKIHKTGKSYPQIVELLNMLNNSEEEDEDEE